MYNELEKVYRLQLQAKKWDEHRRLSERIGVHPGIDQSMFWLYLAYDLSSLAVRMSESSSQEGGISSGAANPTEKKVKVLPMRRIWVPKGITQKVTDEARCQAQRHQSEFYPVRDSRAFLFAATLNHSTRELTQNCPVGVVNNGHVILDEEFIVDSWAMRWKPLVEKDFEGSWSRREMNQFLASVLR
jgi:hypothetical protein